MQFGPPEFHSLAEAIVYSTAERQSCGNHLQRFAALTGEPLDPRSHPKLSDEQMREPRIVEAESAYLKDLAAKTAGGLLDFSRLSSLRTRR